MNEKKLLNNKPKKSLKQSLTKELKRNWELYLLVSVPIAFLIVFSYVPMYGVQIAFKDYKPGIGVWASEWVGLKHFERFVSNYQFKRIVWNTLAINLYGLCTFPLSIILALMLNYIRNQRFKKTVQMISYAPHFISTVIMVGMIIQFLDAKNGMINHVLGIFGVEAQNYMAKLSYFRHIYVWTDVWQGIGYGSIMYIAALASVSPELHEAAIIDGATILQRMRHVDLPGILPTVAIQLIFRCAGMLSLGYEKVYLMQNSLNIKHSEVISTYVYKQGLAYKLPQFSYSTAIGLFLSVINLIILLIVNKITDKITKTSLF